MPKQVRHDTFRVQHDKKSTLGYFMFAMKIGVISDTHLREPAP